MTAVKPELCLLEAPDWVDYALLDSGNGARLERFGPYTFVRPEHQAIWQPTLSTQEWSSPHAVFHASAEETGGKWEFHKTIHEPWQMQYRGLKFWAHMSSSRHLGVFPEQASQWEWINRLVVSASRPVRVLNLFGYTGLASLAAAQAGASVTHVDASKKSMTWARDNQTLSKLEQKPIRWILDDAFKFVQRESRRQAEYDGFILDPPKFGRGPKGEVWECFDMLPELLRTCRSLLSPRPLFIVITAYAIRASALSLYYALGEMVKGLGGTAETGELVLREQSAGRILSTAIYARWSAGESFTIKSSGEVG